MLFKSVHAKLLKKKNACSWWLNFLCGALWQDSISGDEALVVTSTLMFQGRRELQEKLPTAQSAAAVAAELTVT